MLLPILWTLTMGHAQTTTFIAPNGATEICKITQFPGAKYSKKDLAKMQKLCELDWHSDQPQWERKKKLTTIALCPKLVKTSPALEFFSLNEGVNRTDAEVKCESIKDDGKKFAKFKVSISCAYSPNILAYAHFSKFFDIGDVPLAVYRTFDRNTYLEYAKIGSTLTDENSGWLGKNWVELQKRLEAKSSAMVLPDGQTAYGALSETLKGEKTYNEFIGNGPKDYLKSEEFKTLKENKPIEKLYPKSMRNLGEIFELKDLSDVLIFDALMSQYDRYGNIHYYKYYYYLENGKLKREKQDDEDLEQSQRMQALGAKLFKRMVLKDNDCGLRFQNLTWDHGGLTKIRHLSKDTYQKLLELEGLLKEESFKTWLSKDLKFEMSDTVLLEKNLKQLLGLLTPKVQKGEILLDLNPLEWAVTP